MRSSLDIRNIEESHLSLLDRSLIEYITRDILESEIDTTLLHLFDDMRSDGHLPLESEDIHPRESLGSTLSEYRLDIVSPDWHIDWSYREYST